MAVAPDTTTVSHNIPNRYTATHCFSIRPRTRPPKQHTYYIRVSWRLSQDQKCNRNTMPLINNILVRCWDSQTSVT